MRLSGTSLTTASQFAIWRTSTHWAFIQVPIKRVLCDSVHHTVLFKGYAALLHAYLSVVLLYHSCL